MPTPPFHSRAIIISTGDEIITGQLLDTNSRYLADQLVSLGILPIQHLTLPDELPVLAAELRRACSMADLIIMSGGLGPTDGDLTRQALAELTNSPLVIDPASESAITQMLAKRSRPMTDRQRRQALRPESATAIPNRVGTAPGLHAVVGSADVFCLPGPPGELRMMFMLGATELLRPDPTKAIVTRLLHIVGIPEADCVEQLGDLVKRDHSDSDAALVGITASGGVLTLRIRAAGQRAATMADDAEARARGVLGDHILSPFGGEQTTAAVPPETGTECLARTALQGLESLAPFGQLAVVESCTGGMLGQIITDIPGASATFRGGFITYADDLKEHLGVDWKAVRDHGAVSPEVARQMAVGGLLNAGADFCLAITGIAGPEGGSESKPVGTVHIALAERARQPGMDPAPSVHSRHFLFTGMRAVVRQRACTSALTMLYFRLKSHPLGEPRLLWELPPQPPN